MRPHLGFVLGVVAMVLRSGAAYGQIGVSDSVKVQDVRVWRHYQRYCPNVTFNTRDSSFSWLPSNKPGSEVVNGGFRKDANTLVLLRPDGKVLKEVRCTSLSPINDTLVELDRRCCDELMAAYPVIWFYGADSSFRWMRGGERGEKRIQGSFHFDDGVLVLTGPGGGVVGRFDHGRSYAKRTGAACVVTEHLSQRSLFGHDFMVVHW
jgi:hypothetical protein